ncbi:MAG: hypothetical protein PHC68_00435 [Syntrophorhabdaceae bacterium]|nr:hypothetical protein [Syntrophorhabdaceae bacterium]
MKTFFLIGAICGIVNIIGVFILNNPWHSALGWTTATVLLIGAYREERK